MGRSPTTGYHNLAQGRDAIRTQSHNSSEHRLDRRTLWRDDTIEVLSTQWDRHRHPHSCEAMTNVAVMEFMLAGAFRKESDTDVVVGDCNSAVLFRAGEVFAVDHPTGGMNAGLSIRLHDSFAPALLDEMGGAASAAVSSDAFAMVMKLAHRLNQAAVPESHCVEQSVHVLLDRVLDGGRRVHGCGRSSERNRVRAAQSYLSDVTDRPVALAEVSQAMAWSPWHLVRAFQRHTGVSPYRYHLRLRLRAAMCEMMRGRAELTAIALRAGFSSHSHFTQAFRREFGAPPSAMMRSLRADG